MRPCSPWHVLSITAPDIDGRLLAEITWDNSALLLQGVVASPDGSLSGRYLITPAKEPKDGGRRWDISVVLLPESLRSIR